MVLHYTSLKHFVTCTKITRLWIYAWDCNENTNILYLYALPITNNNNNEDNNPTNLNPLPVIPIAIQFDASTYNHLVFVTRNKKLAQRAIEILHGCGLLEKTRSYFGSWGEGYLIMRQLSFEELDKKMYLGIPVFIYVRDVFACRKLYAMLQYNYSVFGIEALGIYRNAMDCYFNHRRRESANFQSRGLFKIIETNNQLYELSFVGGDLWTYCPSFTMLLFDLQTSRISNSSDSNNSTNHSNPTPTGSTLYDRIILATFQKTSVKIAPPNFTQNQNQKTKNESGLIFNNRKTWSVGYYPGWKGQKREEGVTFYPTEYHTLQCILHYLNCDESILIVGYDTENYLYRFLFKRAAWYGLLPRSVSKISLLRCCGSIEDPLYSSILLAPWIMKIDLKLYRCRFFENNTPSSDSLEAFAQQILNNYKSDLQHRQQEHRQQLISNLYYKLEGGGVSNDNDDRILTDLLRSRLYKMETITRIVSTIDIVGLTFSLGQIADAGPDLCLKSHSKIAVVRRFLENNFQSIIIAPMDYQTPERHFKDCGYGYLLSGILTRIEREKEEREREGGVCQHNWLKHNSLNNQNRGGFVLRPDHPGIYRDVECWDFKSFYPSIIHSFNLQTGFVTAISKKEIKRTPTIKNTNKYDILDLDDEILYVSVKKTQDNEEAPIGKVCKMLLSRKNEYTKRGLTNLARSIKILLNSIYGLTSCKNDKWRDTLVCTMITAYGRMILDSARKIVVEDGRYKIIAADTDSLFLTPINTNNNNNNNNNNWYCKFNQWVGHLYPQAELICLDYKKTYSLFVICSAKKYVGIVRDFNDEIEMVGFPNKTLSIDHWNNLRILIQELLNSFVIKTTNNNITNINDFIFEWIIKQINKHETNDEKYYENIIRIKSSRKYKDRTCLPYILACQYEQFKNNNNNNGNDNNSSHNSIIEKDGIRLAYYRLLSLVPFPNKERCVCYVKTFDCSLQTIDKTQSIIDKYNCIDSFTKAINPNAKSLTNIMQKYVSLERLRLIQLYKKKGYLIYDITNSNNNKHINYLLHPGLNITNLPQIFTRWHRSFDTWYKSSLLVEEGEIKKRKKGRVFLLLKAVLHHNKHGNKMWITLPSYKTGTKFMTLSEIQHLFPQWMRQSIYLTFDQTISQKIDADNFLNMKAFMYLLYVNSSSTDTDRDASFTESDKDELLLWSSSSSSSSSSSLTGSPLSPRPKNNTNNNSSWLIILPYVAFKKQNKETAVQLIH